MTTRQTATHDRTAVLEDWRLLYQLGLDVNPLDRVSTVTDREGGTVVVGPMRIVAIQHLPDHSELFLERYE